MSPHKPDPIPFKRTVEVDISSILIRPEELDSSGLTRETQPANIFRTGRTEKSRNRYTLRVSSAGWANVAFALGACFLGFFCTLSIFENMEHFRRAAHLSDDAIYARPKPDATHAEAFSQKTIRLATRAKTIQPRVALDERSLSLEQNPASTTLLPLGGLSSSPLLANNAHLTNSPFVNNVSGVDSSASSAPARSSMSQEMPSSPETTNGEPETNSEQSRPKYVARRGQMSISSARSRISSSRQNSHFGIATGSHSQPQRAGTTQHASGRSAMTMHSGGGGIAAMQNHVGSNHMQMEHGMIAQPVLTGGVGGLNRAGLGGGGNRGANARR